jgi:hypothetical protein
MFAAIAVADTPVMDAAGAGATIAQTPLDMALRPAG